MCRCCGAMVSRDYTKEVGLPSGQKTVSKPIAIAVVLALVAGGWYAARTLAATHHADEAPHTEAVQPK